MHDERKVGRFRDATGRVNLGIFTADGAVAAKGDLFSELEPFGNLHPYSDIFILPPLFPQKIVGIGSNYLGHILEMGRTKPSVPKMFLKPTSAVIGPNIAIELPPETVRVDHEAELGVVIGRRCSRVSLSEAMNFVLGYTVVNDVTARDFQKKDGVFARAKGFDTFCPIGPVILRSNSLAPRRVRCWVNDECRQDGNTDDLCFDIPTLVSFVSSVMTLQAGDVIATGTPSGVGPLLAGDRVVAEIEGIGRLENPVINRADRL
ncbi:MAG: fumarylacetoacetate hydrolase family protein [Myxococcota bacterium]|nr:fumarylacetoacetate hydrolase family protein [Myxococcota bacterium]MEC8378837.1 fumarylacetoacetate hydrolase family protein [Myxococcota bacterium]